MNPPSLRAIPSVEKLRQALGPLDLPRPAVTALIRRELATLRGEIEAAPAPDFAAVLARVRSALDRLRSSRLQPVINATGVIIHTNLGRVPLAAPAVEAIAGLAANYNNLEFDLARGERGARADYLEKNLALLCGAEAATVVNNCAAALVLIVRHFTRGAKKEVVISRGELVQIGGGFRIPDILEASGATLREVGTTNRTDAADYAAALGANTALVLKIHPSNFYQGGFTTAPPVAEIAALARKDRVPFVEDLGSGAVGATEGEAPGVEHERTLAEAVRDGADLVCSSGDKLFGGPQSGLIAGRAKRIAALKREPFFRAMRCDKLILGGAASNGRSPSCRPRGRTSGAGFDAPRAGAVARPGGANRRRAGGSAAAGHDRRTARPASGVARCRVPRSAPSRSISCPGRKRFRSPTSPPGCVPARRRSSVISPAAA